MIYPIVLKNKDDILRLNKVASEAPCRLTISTITGPAVYLDARTLLGLFPFMGQQLYLVGPDHMSPKAFDKIVKRIERS